jgi:hypothetical protein
VEVDFEIKRMGKGVGGGPRPVAGKEEADVGGVWPRGTCTGEDAVWLDKMRFGWQGLPIIIESPILPMYI